jgi:hypothetical protein
MPWLLLAAALCVLVGVAHSWLGEKNILIRLFRRDDLPKLFGSDWFTKRTLRFAWHLTSVAWWGLGGVLVAVADGSAADPAAMRQRVIAVVAVTFLIHAVLTAAASRGRHYAWMVFLAIAACAAFAAFAR